MPSRERKAQVIVASCTIKYVAGHSFAVESMRSRGKYYFVEAGATKNKGKCGCRDWISGRTCKHVFAIWLILAHYGDKIAKQWTPGYVVPPIDYDAPPSKRNRGHVMETFDDDYAGARRREPVVIRYAEGAVGEAARRAAAVRDTPIRVPQLAAELARVATTGRRQQPLRGGQARPLDEQVFFVLMKAFNNCSNEELMGMLSLYKDAGLVAHIPCRGSLIRYQHSKEVNAALKEMLKISASPVRDIETMIAIDGTGFGTCITANLRDEKHRGIQQRARNKFMMATAAVGCATNMVVSAAFCRTEGSEINYFERLVAAGKATWSKLSLVLGDKLYSDNPRIEQASRIGLLLISPTRYGRDTYQANESGSWLWDFCNVPQAFASGTMFDDVYCYRSKVESVFSAIKRTMGWHLRIRLSKREQEIIRSEVFARQRGDKRPIKDGQLYADYIGTGRENELLARFIAWNLRVLVVLEKLHDQTVDFMNDGKFRPFPRQRLSSYHPRTGRAPKLPHSIPGWAKKAVFVALSRSRQGT